jgi:hypothetical protein
MKLYKVEFVAVYRAEYDPEAKAYFITLKEANKFFDECKYATRLSKIEVVEPTREVIREWLNRDGLMVHYECSDETIKTKALPEGFDPSSSPPYPDMEDGV